MAKNPPTTRIGINQMAMKILFFLGLPNPFPGAGWTRIGFFVDAWSKNGHSIEVLGTFTYKSFSKRGIRKMGNANIFNLIFNMGINHPAIFILNCLVSLITSTLFLSARKPDITMVSVPTGDSGVGVLIACTLTKTKCVIDYRDEWEDYLIGLTNSKISKSFFCIIKKISTGIYAKKLVVAVTPKTLDALKSRGLYNLKLISNGADTRIFKPSIIKKGNEKFAIFYSGFVGAYYRLDVVVKAVKRLVDKGFNNINLLVAGEGEIKSMLSLAEKLAITDQIKYIGSINDKTKLAKSIAVSDAGIIPYDGNPLWKNSIPAKFYEYCACGIPVIATTHSDSLLAEIIRTHQIGVSSPPLDEEKLAEAILWLYKNKPFREVAGKRARKLIEEKFDRNKIAEEYLSITKQIVAQK
ncbi:MAG: glycosyltransferase family 4 protein [Candidatus Bathyarchaeia archaeon]